MAIDKDADCNNNPIMQRGLLREFLNGLDTTWSELDVELASPNKYSNYIHAFMSE